MDSFPARGDVCCRTRNDLELTDTAQQVPAVLTDVCVCVVVSIVQWRNTGLNDPPVGSQGMRLSQDPIACVHVPCAWGVCLCVYTCASVCKHADAVASSSAFLGNKCETMDQCKGREGFHHPTVCLCVRSMPSDGH